MAHTLPDLPFPRSALAPRVSAETLGYHHGRHHAGYVRALNEQLDGHPLADASVEDVIRRIGEVAAPIRRGVLRNAGQHLAHSLLWRSLRPPSDDGPTGPLARAIDASFGSHDALVSAFSAACSAHFASGWCWLLAQRGSGLVVVTTQDAVTPAASTVTPLLVCDLWEHAYYLDHRNDRAAYVEAFFEIADWQSAGETYAESAKDGVPGPAAGRDPPGDAAASAVVAASVACTRPPAPPSS